ncbi:response regulator [Roseospirillum parvum]|uniref:Regulatory protein VirG n=1 Tax=Roseospirillum parvum TaxID=83401 RepID=A0A1G8FS94_9PROT|nr:response regulator [Roseospirillum parvum]SDH85038.1 DNA-binding response regulator, OmpR family, contains REC and winged-helix (wHTH) domain [Roseospirillum parvum]
MERTPHLLVVDDDREIRTLLGRFLGQHGFRVSLAAEGREMMRALEEKAIDLVVLDLMMPGEDGLSLCRRVRVDSALPIIMLTAAGEDIDRIVGLEMGADDYLPKPFNPRELLARIRAVLRRHAALPPLPGEAGPDENGGPRYRFAGFELDTGGRTVRDPDGAELPLTAGEYDLLLCLVQRPRRVLSRDQLLDLTRGRTAAPFDRSIDVQIGRLRKKIEADPKEPSLIKTVRGGGYLLAAEVTRAGDTQ